MPAIPASCGWYPATMHVAMARWPGHRFNQAYPCPPIPGQPQSDATTCHDFRHDS